MFRYLLKSNILARSTQQQSPFRMLSLMGAGYFAYLQQMKKQSECLGIFGFVGNEQAEDGGLIAEEVCIRGLRELCSSGYDSCGIASLEPSTQKLVVSKHAQETRYGGDCFQKLASSAKS